MFGMNCNKVQTLDKVKIKINLYAGLKEMYTAGATPKLFHLPLNLAPHCLA